MRSKRADKRAGFILGIGALLWISGCGLAAQPSPSPVLATVGPDRITEQDWKLAVAATNVLAHTHLPTSAAAKKAQVEELVQQKAVERWSLNHHVIDMATAEKQATNFIAQHLEPMAGGSRGLSQALQKNNLSSSDFHQFVADQIILQAAFNRQTQHITTLAPGQALKYYDQHKAMFVTPKTALVREIVVPSKVLAQTVMDQIKAGASFQALARKYSLDKVSAAQGGSLGWIQLNSTSGLDPQAYRLVKTLSPGKFGIARTKLGYSIIEVQAAKPGTLVPYGTVKPEIVAQLVQNRRAAEFQTWASGIEQKAHVQMRGIG